MAVANVSLKSPEPSRRKLASSERCDVLVLARKPMISAKRLGIDCRGRAGFSPRSFAPKNSSIGVRKPSKPSSSNFVLHHLCGKLAIIVLLDVEAEMIHLIVDVHILGLTGPHALFDEVQKCERIIEQLGVDPQIID